MLENNLTEINDQNEDIEFFLSEDIIQGEKIPFYILWKRENPKEIHLELEGFKYITELHNVKESKTIIKSNKTIINDFHIPGYIGGLLSTEITNQPIINGSLTVTIFEKNGNVKSLKKERKLYTTKLKFNGFPEEIYFNESNINSEINIELKGKTTVFLEIEEMEQNECFIDIPPDVKAIFLKFHESLMNGFKELKGNFPEHSIILEYLQSIPDSKISVTRYLEKYGEVIKESFEDKIFFDAFTTVIISSFFEQVGLEDRLLKPLTEYFESSAVDRAYFSNPLLQVKVPKDGCLLAIKLKGMDLLNQDCGEPLEIKVPLKANVETFKPLKDLFSIRRNTDE